MGKSMQSRSSLSIDELFNKLISTWPFKFEGNFYEYIESKFDAFQKDVLCLNECEISDFFKNEQFIWNGSTTLRRFSNYLNWFCDKLKEILLYCYRGEYYLAEDKLLKLFLNKNRYLSDQYPYLVPLFIHKDSILYRCRIIEINEDDPTDCWHIPYNLSKRMRPDRFNVYRYPTLYLGDTENTCINEIKEIEELNEEKYKFFCQGFRANRLMYFCDLTIPVNNDNLVTRDKFLFIMRYPLLILSISHYYDCMDVIRFRDEYLFPQRLFHVLLSSDFFKFSEEDYRNRYHGICYTSFCGGTNYVLPAKHPDIQTKKITKDNVHFDGHSTYLEGLLTINGKPKEFNKQLTTSTL